MPFKDIRSLSVHISKNHHIDTRTYYDNHVKSSGEGLCKVCGNPTKFHTISDGYRECCSQKCSNKLMFLDKDRAAKVKAKRVDTCMKKYGVTNAGGTKESLEKAQQTHLAKRGVKWAMQSKDVVDKSKETCLKKYGTTTYVHSEEGAARVEATVMAKFDRPNFFSGNVGNVAAREAYQAKYGYDHNMHDPGFLEKWKTNQKEKNEGKYFVETDEFKEKSRDTQITKYGAWHSASEHGKKLTVAKYENELKKFNCSLLEISDKNNIKFKCGICETETTENSNYIKFRVRHDITPCPHCYCKSMPTSCEEQEVSNFIKGLGLIVTHYDRDFLDNSGADIVVESAKLIVEYDGIYWHSEQYRSADYHLRKKLCAEKKGYRLVHLFSDEWTYSKSIVKSRLVTILNKCNIYGMNKLYARKCTIADVPAKDSTAFLKSNHLQGNIDSPWRVGLFYDDKLVSLMTFGRNRFSGGIEMHRFCTKIDTIVVGAAGKLFAHFVETHPEVDTITSYADARWSTSHAFYEKLGFTLESMSSPGYFIVDGDIRRNRMQFQKHKIAGPGDENKTEHEITLERGLYRIYDCGQYRYVWHRTKDESSP